MRVSDPVVVLALDAADRELAKRWSCENLLLEEHTPIETFSWSKDEPYTPEVWATVATGVMPDQHGIGEDSQEATWDNPLLDAASTVTQHLPPRYRQALGRPFRSLGADWGFETVNGTCTTAFDATLSWPGVDDATHLHEMWSLADEIARGDGAEADASEVFQRLTYQEIGWLAARADGDGGVFGAHCHTLDVAGHLFCERESRLREWYEWMDDRVGWLRAHTDRLVVLSDHGMQVSWLGLDDDPGSHSWRPFIAADGLDGKLPRHVADVAAWLQRRRGPPAERPETSSADGMDTPTETLQDLGYLS